MRFYAHRHEGKVTADAISWCVLDNLFPRSELKLEWYLAEPCGCPTPGEMARFQFKFYTDWDEDDIAAGLFGIGKGAAEYLFDPLQYEYWNSMPPKMVANRIREFLLSNGSYQLHVEGE